MNSADDITGATPLRKVIERLLRSCAWNTVAVVGSRFAVLIAMIITARILGRDALGQFASVQGLALVCVTFVLPGLNIAIPRLVTEARVANSADLGSILIASQLTPAVCGLAMAMLCGLTSSLLAVHVLNDPALHLAVLAASVLVLFMTMTFTQSGVLMALREYRLVAVHGVVGGVGTLILMPVGAWWGGPAGAIAGLALSGALQTWFGLAVIRRHISREDPGLSVQRELATMKSVLKLAAPAGTAGAILLPVEWIAIFQMLHSPHGVQHVGLYSAACVWSNALMILPSLIAQSSLPLVVERRKIADSAGAYAVLLMSIGISLAVIVPLSLAGWMLSGSVMALHGPEFEAASVSLRWQLGIAVIAAVQSPLTMAMQASSRSRSLSVIYLVWGAFYLIAVSQRAELTANTLAETRFFAYCLLACLLAGYSVATLCGSETRHRFWRWQVKGT